MQIISDDKIIIEIKDKNGIYWLDKLSVYYSFSSTIIKKKKYIIKIIYLIKKRRLTIIRIQLFILILNVNIKNNEEDFINDEKYLNKNNHLSWIVFL